MWSSSGPRYKTNARKGETRSHLKMRKGWRREAARKIFGTSSSKDAELDFVMWVSNQRSEGIMISRMILNSKDYEIANEYD